MVQVCLVCTALQWDSGGSIGWSYKGQFQSLLTYYSPGCLQYTEMTYFKSQQSKLFEFIVKMFRNEIRQGQSQNISLYCHWFYVRWGCLTVQSSPPKCSESSGVGGLSWTLRFSGQWPDHRFLVVPNDSGHCWSRMFSSAWGIFMVWSLIKLVYLSYRLVSNLMPAHRELARATQKMSNTSNRLFLNSSSFLVF